MLHCSHCGKALNNKEGSYCTFCGMAIAPVEHILNGNILADKVYFHMPANDKRACDIKVFSDKIVFEGRFWYLKNKEFYRCRTYKETALIKNFIGMGYLAKRSYRKCMAFILGGTALQIIKTIIDKLSDMVDKINEYLQWIDKTIELPEWLTYSMNMAAFLCVVLGIMFLFSKKKMVEISFIDKRICLPQKSINLQEFYLLQQNIVKLKQE